MTSTPSPPPPILRLVTLGYVGATTDVLWSKLLIENGVHWSEHRPFADTEHYLDAIVELDPKFRPLYEYVDSLLCYRPMNGHEVEARESRAYLQRGVKEFPNDAQIWLKFGQFVAFMGPSYLANEEEARQWKREGALAMAHAVDLGADIQFGVAASALLDSRLSERDAAIDALERAYAVTDDEVQRAEIAARLEAKHASKAADRARVTIGLVESAWRRSYPFVSRGTYLLLSPFPDAFRCAGQYAVPEPACARSWDDISAVEP